MQKYHWLEDRNNFGQEKTSKVKRRGPIYSFLALKLPKLCYFEWKPSVEAIRGCAPSQLAVFPNKLNKKLWNGLDGFLVV